MNTARDDGGPAFPFNAVDTQPCTGEQVVRDQYCGASLRDHFAGQALIGLLSSVSDEPCQSTDRAGIEREQHEFAAKMAKFAYWYADAMIAECKK